MLESLSNRQQTTLRTGEIGELAEPGQGSIGQDVLHLKHDQPESLSGEVPEGNATILHQDEHAKHVEVGRNRIG